MFMQTKTTKMMNKAKQNGPRNMSAAYRSETSNFRSIISNSIWAVRIGSAHAQLFEWNSRKNKVKYPKKTIENIPVNEIKSLAA